MAEIKNKYHQMNELTMANAYLENNIIPYYDKVVIKDIISLNYNNNRCKFMKLLTYGSFHEIDSNLFPKPTKANDNKLTDQVSPILLIDNNDNVYRIHHLLWPIITDVISGNYHNQIYGIESIFPYEIYIDNDNEWCIKLVDRIKPKNDEIKVKKCVCGHDGNKICGKCKDKTYCSRECQQKDWIEHKKTCEIKN